MFGKVNDGLEKIGFKKERRRFHPHFTIARVRGGEKRDKLVEQLVELEAYEFGVVQVDRIALKKSILTRSGPIYSTLTKSKLAANI